MRDPQPATDSSVRILIIDDSSMMRTLLARMVQAEPGWSVVDTAVDGQDAIEKVARVRPDICLLDLEMPRMGGIEALPHLRALSDTEVVVVSSIAQPGTAERLRCLSLGATAVVAKPSGAVSPDMAERRQRDLKGAIRLALAHRALLAGQGDGGADPDADGGSAGDDVPDDAADAGNGP